MGPESEKRAIDRTDRLLFIPKNNAYEPVIYRHWKEYENNFVSKISDNDI